jgi:hypothetical protein
LLATPFPPLEPRLRPFTQLLFIGKTSLFLETPLDQHRAIFRATLNAGATELSGI